MIVSLLVVVALHKQALKLPSLFSDNMVLQRDANVPFFGTANPDETVSVQLDGQAATAKAGSDGKWIVRLQPLQAGGPFTAYVQSGASTVEIKSVMVGEVWLCSGQSNMELPESAASDYTRAQDEANPAIRMFTVSQTAVDEPSSDAKGAWVPASKYTVGSFSAVALSFGRELHERLNVPIGLINASWGGTQAQAWISKDALFAVDALRPLVESYQEAKKGLSHSIRYLQKRTKRVDCFAGRHRK